MQKSNFLLTKWRVYGGKWNIGRCKITNLVKNWENFMKKHWKSWILQWKAECNNSAQECTCPKQLVWFFQFLYRFSRYNSEKTRTFYDVIQNDNQKLYQLYFLWGSSDDNLPSSMEQGQFFRRSLKVFINCWIGI